jgi:hypothetical protein
MAVAVKSTHELVQIAAGELMTKLQTEAQAGVAVLPVAVQVLPAIPEAIE